MEAGSVTIVAARPAARFQQLALLTAGVSWLSYTASFSTLSHVHATLPPCPFYALTGHPCPFCGGTRSFAATWRGDIGSALHLYPLGPLLFALTFAGVAAIVALLTAGRTVRVSALTQARIVQIGLAALAVQWALKLLWLGNT